MPLPRLDLSPELSQYLRRYCRIAPGEIWDDPRSQHRVGCLMAEDGESIKRLVGEQRASLALHDPPYNQVAFEQKGLQEFLEWGRQWVEHSYAALGPTGSLYIWLGADQRNGFQPLPDFILMMRQTGFQSRSFITMRNQRGYGTQQNWMAVRQELLYYVKGEPFFDVLAEYTDIPKILRGYYKEVNGQLTENGQRGKSENIRAGNVWVDVQQVFYRMEENVNGCYAQKPLKSCERIIQASSQPGDLIVDFFSHSGTTLLAAEKLGRRCYTTDSDPLYCEITLRRLENFRQNGLTGWQNSNPFEKELSEDSELRRLAGYAGEAD